MGKFWSKMCPQKTSWSKTDAPWGHRICIRSMSPPTGRGMVEKFSHSRGGIHPVLFFVRKTAKIVLARALLWPILGIYKPNMTKSTNSNSALIFRPLEAGGALSKVSGVRPPSTLKSLRYGG